MVLADHEFLFNFWAVSESRAVSFRKSGPFGPDRSRNKRLLGSSSITGWLGQEQKRTSYSRIPFTHTLASRHRFKFSRVARNRFLRFSVAATVVTKVGNCSWQLDSFEYRRSFRRSCSSSRRIWPWLMQYGLAQFCHTHTHTHIHIYIYIY